MEDLKEKLQAFLNFTNSNGEVKTYFGGRITSSQLIVIILVIIGVVLVCKLFKKAMRIISIITILGFGSIHNYLASPTQLTDIDWQSISRRYESYASMSDNIKIDGGELSIKLSDNWVSIQEIQSFVNTGFDKVTVVVNGESYATADSKIISLLNALK